MSDDDRPARPDMFAHPNPADFDYRPLLEALRECRMRVGEMMSKTGPRNPMYVEAESLLAYVDAVARLTRVPGALKLVRQKNAPKQ